ncbi:MAG: hypothetical protein WC822_01640 [Candidatus Paceibacterota bacterium]
MADAEGKKGRKGKGRVTKLEGSTPEEVKGLVESRITIYFGLRYAPVLKRIKAIVERHPSLNESGLIVLCCAACIETLEKEIPLHRSFMLNGVEVEA